MAAEEDKVNTGAIATISAVGALAMVGITWALTGFIRAEVDLQAEKAGAHAATGPVAAANSAQRAELAQPMGWIDQKGGVAHVPLDRAKQLVLEDLQRDPSSATPAPPPPPPPPPPPDGGADAADGGAPDAAAPDAPESGKKKKKKPAPVTP